MAGLGPTDGIGLSELDFNTGDSAGAAPGEDPWARFADQLGWEQQAAAAAAAETLPAEPPAVAALEPLAPAPSLSPPPAPAPPPPVEAGHASATSLRAEPTVGQRAAWRARAQELGLSSVFIEDADIPLPAPEPPAESAAVAPAPAVSAQTAPAQPASGVRLLGTAHLAGGLLSTVSRPDPPAAPVPEATPPPPEPLPNLPEAPIARLAKLARQSLALGKQLARQLFGAPPDQGSGGAGR